ncbi:hypothetical protein FSP39_013081 [Pinctada imbricata]|uniref:J domain-containing protein n=1 Tax=Pinctada imbricata TaxID=66713 RepID=A0AA88Y3K6_PINIB|nr:hypothetical protein FSP39_013081 [Pinctada imbricata]
MFFCECGVIQEVDKLGYFQVLGMPEKFDVDLESLSQNYKNLQRQLHPDKHSLKPKREQDLAEQQSSYVVNAYQTIMKPLSRAMYLLEINGNPLEEENTSVDQDFLMQIMETNEEIIEADSSEDLRKIEEVNDQNIKECIQNISQAFGTNNIDLAKSWTIKLKYFCNIDGKLREIKQISFD